MEVGEEHYQCQAGSYESLANGNHRRRQSRGQDSLGEIPKVLPSTALADPVGMQEYFERSHAEIKAFRSRADAALNAGRMEESVRMYSLAVNLLSQILQEDDRATSKVYTNDLARILFRRACARLRSSRDPLTTRDAVSDLDTSLELHPTQPLALLQKGLALIRLGEYSAASLTLLVGLGQSPTDLALRRRFDDALTSIRRNHKLVTSGASMPSTSPASPPLSQSLRGKQGLQGHVVNITQVIESELQSPYTRVNLSEIVEAEMKYWKGEIKCTKAELESQLAAVIEIFLPTLIRLHLAFCAFCAGHVPLLKQKIATTKALNSIMAEKANDKPTVRAPSVSDIESDYGSEELDAFEGYPVRKAVLERQAQKAALAQSALGIHVTGVANEQGEGGIDGGIMLMRERATTLDTATPIPEEHVVDETYTFTSFSQRRSMSSSQLIELLRRSALISGQFGWGNAVAVLQVVRDQRKQHQKEVEIIQAEEAKLAAAKKMSTTTSFPKSQPPPSRPPAGNQKSPLVAMRMNVKDSGDSYSSSDSEEGENMSSAGGSFVSEASLRSTMKEDTQAAPLDDDARSTLLSKVILGRAQASSMDMCVAALLSEGLTGGTDGGILFPEFVEILVRLCLARYMPASMRAYKILSVLDKKTSTCYAPQRLTFAFRKHILASAMALPPPPSSSNNTIHTHVHTHESTNEGQDIDIEMASAALDCEQALLAQMYVYFLAAYEQNNAGPGGAVKLPPALSFLVKVEPVVQSGPKNGSQKGSQNGSKQSEGLPVHAFLDMLLALQLLDDNLTVREATRIALSCCSTKLMIVTSKAQVVDKQLLMSKVTFAAALYFCCDVKLHDGLCSSLQRITSFVANEVKKRFLKLRSG